MIHKLVSKVFFAALIILLSSLIVSSASGAGLPPAVPILSNPPPPVPDEFPRNTYSRPADEGQPSLPSPEKPSPAAAPTVSPDSYGSRFTPGESFALPEISPESTQITCTATQDFETMPPANWLVLNQSNPPGLTTWFEGNSTVFPAQAGTATSYAAANYNNTAGTGVISDWLITPVMTFQNGDTVRFYTRTTTSSTYPDRLQLRLSTAGSGVNIPGDAFGVGDFSTLLIDVNPSYTVGGYPEGWTEYSVILGGLSGPTLGRLAFRYFVENGGPSAGRSNYIGIDTFSVCRDNLATPPNCMLAEDYATVPPASWVINNLSNPLGVLSWYQGNNTIPAQSGGPFSYAAANYNSVGTNGTISDWFISPEMVFTNGDAVQFYTRTTAGSTWPDRMQVRLSTNLNSAWVGANESSVGDFTTLLLDINPGLIQGGYPEGWTAYTILLKDLTRPTPGRLAFRYYVTNAGSGGVNSNFIGVDTFSVCRFPVYLPFVQR